MLARHQGAEASTAAAQTRRMLRNSSLMTCLPACWWCTAAGRVSQRALACTSSASVKVMPCHKTRQGRWSLTQACAGVSKHSLCSNMLCEHYGVSVMQGAAFAHWARLLPASVSYWIATHCGKRLASAGTV